MDNITEIFCLIDDFCEKFIPTWEQRLITDKIKIRKRQPKLTYSEIMTIIVLFHQSGFKNFKLFYLRFNDLLKSNFPNILSYNRFIEIQPRVIIPLCIFLQTLSGEETGVYMIDSTPLNVCNIKRANQHKVFEGLAKKSRSTMGWFYGFKLHLVINNKGEIMGCKLTQANIDDRTVVENLTEGLTGKIVGDKGYIQKKLSENLWERGLQLLTKIKKNMKNKLVTMEDKYLLSKRGLIETVIGQLKTEFNIEHTRHRSVNGFLCNLFGSLIAYSFKQKKPAINLYSTDYQLAA